ncbi:uncharacterized protein N7459_008798 [Penicillium hispanicum]|uniref:uncharacterized protein n=1 Tax=Penicillium hispanicum TaxID=1080232 RepID=UPI0025416D07|nr:uncharacterized protein N7459_008798 [Penicillium hispanicum]KAJ5574371.1 hypothetical protein N7459_008798 [Penicillium hispanicum]
MARIKGVFSWEDVLAQRYQSNKPAPLARARRRTLAAAQPQPQCQLLSRLSPELRLMIWEMALGGLRLHIIQRSHQRLGHVVCPLGATGSSDINRDQDTSPRRAREPFCEICHGGGIPQPVKEGDLPGHQDRERLLGLALTCRQIAHESTHLLYTLNTFEFSNPWSLPYLRPTLLPEHWDCIRTVELRWSFPGHWLPSKDPVRAVYVSAGRAQWLETCRTLAQLPALQSFALVLGSSWYSESVEKLPVFLEPLRGLPIQRSRRTAKSALRAEQDFSEACSSDDESFSGSTASLGSSSSCDGSALSVPGLGDGAAPLTPSNALSARATWELRLQGQPYYAHELDWVSDDLRRRGIDCCILTT